MAIGNPTLAAQTATTMNIGNGQTTISIASVVIPAGSLVIAVPFCSNGTTDPAVPTQVTDGTNTSTTADRTNFLSNAGRVSLFSWYDTAGRTATFTATLGAGGTNCSWMGIYTVASAATSAFLDTGNASGSTAATNFAITTLATVAQADSLAFAHFAIGTNIANPTTFPGAGYTSLADVQDATRQKRVFIEYKNGLTAGSTETAGGTASASTGITRAFEVYKGAVATFMPAPELVRLQAVNRSSVY